MTSLGPIFADDLARVKPGDRLRLTISAQTSDAAALAQAALEARARGERVLVVCADPADVPRLAQEMPWFEPNLDVRPLPDWETLPYDVLSPQEELVSERLEALYRLTAPTGGADVLLTSAVTASQRLSPVSYIGANTFFFHQGEQISLTTLQKRLAAAGYANVKQVLAAGEFAVRGSIVDVFPMGSEYLSCDILYGIPCTMARHVFQHAISFDGYSQHLSHQHDVSQRVSHILRIFFLKPTHMIAFRRMYNRSPQ